ncbi:MAG: hypothetical protein ACI85U_003242 [Candidatus Promineifilaceae bacterium]|jgi:hypothetical protein
MAEFEMKQPEEEKKPFYKTPLGIILIVVVVLLLCCCLAGVIALASGASILEGISPVIEKVFEEVQLTVEAGQ